MTHRVIDLKNAHGKKAAIRNGIQHAIYDWIITLDADVILGPFWLTSVSNAINSLECDMIILPLMIDEGKSAFEKMQCIEFMSLLGTTAAMAIAGRPILCNSANLAFRKSAWDNANQMRIDDNISSGDDMFLLHALKKTGKIKWLHSTDAIAYTSPVSTLSEFISQRVRWTSKSLHYRDMETSLTAILVVVINSVLVAFFVLGFENRAYMNLFLVTMLVKTSFDLLLIVRVARWTGKQGLLAYAIVVSILYPFYAMLIPLVGIFYRPKWKGRTISLRPSKKSVREE